MSAANAKTLGFTHVLNVDMVYPDGHVTYLKIPMKDGGANHIDDEKISSVVKWLS